MPSTDYITDLKSVLDQAIRVLQVGKCTSSEKIVFEKVEYLLILARNIFTCTYCLAIALCVKVKFVKNFNTRVGPRF